jgi:hypothetical protein
VRAATSWRRALPAEKQKQATPVSALVPISKSRIVITGPLRLIVSVLGDDLKLGRICGGLWMARIHGQCGG